MGLHSFRSMRRIEARRKKASAFWLKHSQFRASRRHLPSQAKVRSTIQRFGRTTKPLARSDRLTISTLTFFGILFNALRTLITAVGVEFEKKRIKTEHGRHKEFAAVAVLNVGGRHDGVHQEALRIDENVPFLALDFLAGLRARRVMGPPFSALFTLWLSMMAAVGAAAPPACSRHLS